MFSKWCFTVNALPDAFRDGLGGLFNAHFDMIKYICGQIEIAPSTGQRHFQSYIQLNHSQRLSWLKNNISDSAHFEAQKSKDNRAARNYCMKIDLTTVPDTFVELGNFCTGAGQRRDLVEFRDAIRDGRTQNEMMDEFLVDMAKYPRLYNSIRALTKPTRINEFRVVLFYGEPGTGKTRTVWEDHPDHWSVPIGDKIWFDGYDLHPIVLLDDFSGAASKVSLNDTLRLLDRYPIQVPTKGGFTWFMPDIVYITTNIHPRGWYKWLGREVSWRALKRRFHQVVVFEVDGSFDEMETTAFFEDRDLWPDFDVNRNIQ